MTMRIIDGFDYLVGGDGGTLLPRGGWTLSNYSGGFSSSITRFGYGASVAPSINNSAGNNGAGKFFEPYAESTEVFWAGGMYRNSQALSSCGPQIGVGEGVSSGCHLMVRMAPAGQIILYRGTDATSMRNWSFTELARSDPDLFDDFSWNWIEAHAIIADSGGECEVRLNGKTVIHVIDEITANQNAAVPAYVNYGTVGTGGGSDFSCNIDDFAVWDTDGTTCNDWLGTNRIKTMIAVSNGDNIDSTIGGTSPAATNWQSVINPAMNDTKYVYLTDTQVSEYDLYDMDPIISAPYVWAIQLRISARQDDATQMVMRSLLKEGATTTEGADVNLAQTYNFWYTKYEINPDTGFAFTQSEVNSIQVGYKLQSVEP